MLPRVLLIEDDDTIREVYALKLELSGFPVATASNGAVGLQQVARFRPQYILLDLMMPVMGGLEFLEHLRALALTKPPIIIVFSNLTASDTLKNPEELGVSHYWVKSSYTPERVAVELSKHWHTRPA